MSSGVQVPKDPGKVLIKKKKKRHTQYTVNMYICGQSTFQNRGTNETKFEKQVSGFEKVQSPETKLSKRLKSLMT